MLLEILVAKYCEDLRCRRQWCFGQYTILQHLAEYSPPRAGIKWSAPAEQRLYWDAKLTGAVNSPSLNSAADRDTSESLDVTRTARTLRTPTVLTRPLLPDLVAFSEMVTTGARLVTTIRSLFRDCVVLR